MTITDNKTLKPAVRDYYDRLVLITAYPPMVYTKFA